MKILIVKTSSLGDIIHTFPVLEYLHQVHPEAEVDWVAEAPFAELVEANPFVNRVFRADTRNWRKAKGLIQFWKFIKSLRRIRYDVLFDFQGNIKSSLITALAKADKKAGFGRKTVSEWPNLIVTNIKKDPDERVNVRQENLLLAQSYFKDKSPYKEKGVELSLSQDQKTMIEDILKNPQLLNKKKIMVCPGSAWPNKQMRTPALCNLLKKIASDLPCCFLIIWGNDAEKAIAKEISQSLPDQTAVIDKMPIPALQNLMNRMDIVIAMDSLPLHLAGTTTTRTFSVFGASSANKYKPDGDRHIAFQGTCPYGKTFDRRCPILRTCSTGACIREIDVDALYEKFKEIDFSKY